MKFFSADFSKFVHKSIKHKMTPSIFITCDLYLRANKSFVRNHCKIGIATDS